jgi:hypothetical protein
VSSKPGTPAVDDDLEATAELPQMEFSVPPPRNLETAVSTDVYPAIPVGAPELAESLREAEQKLARERHRAQELGARLDVASDRQVVLEAQLTEARARQATLEAQLLDADEQKTGLEARLVGAIDRRAALEAQLATTQARQAALEAQLQSSHAQEQEALAIQHRAADFAELRRRCERQLEALTSWQGFRAVSDALLSEEEARSAQLQAEASKLAESLRMHEKRAALAAPEKEQPALRDELAALKVELGAMQAVLSSVREKLQQAEQRAESEATRAHRLEAEMHANLALLGDPQKNPERRNQEGAGKAAAQKPAALETPLRVLIRQDGGSDVVYPIGRRTTIGRMADNDIQVDTANVSRHHAVLLSSPEHCLVEDLNSTNGVLVNGRRVARQVLRDGDIVYIGRTEFRFQQRA